MHLLDDITALSHAFGTSDYVQGGGGNSSAKSADTLWVKPSGTTLAGMTPESFVALDRAKLGRLFTLDVPPDATAREVLVKDVMLAAVKPGQTARPSVEAPLHDILTGAFVVHTHPALVNGLVCSQRAAETVARLFPDALWVPYIDPGYTLCMGVRRHVQDYTQRRGRSPSVILLQNHGLFVTADTADAMRGLYGHVMQTLRREYEKAGIATELPNPKQAPAEAVEAMKQTLRALLGPDAIGMAYGGIFAVPPEPLSPDQIVYAKSFPYEGPLTRESVAAFRARRGYTPWVAVTPAGVFGLGTSQRKAEVAVELTLDAALVRQLTDAFGGPRYLTERDREFIEHWEAEFYRRKQMG